MSGSSSMPYACAWCAATAWRSAGMPGPGGYWFAAVADRSRRGLGDRARAVRVREALPEVDRPGRGRQRRHLGEDRGAQAGEVRGQQRPGPGRHRATVRP